MAESEHELMSLLNKVKEDSGISGLKTQHSKTSPMTSWQIDGENVETVSDFIFLGSKITVDGACSHEIKRLLLLGRISMSNLNSALKKQRYHSSNKGPYHASYDFSRGCVYMWEVDPKEGWAPKNWHFKLWCWRRLLRVPWTARRSNQSTLKESTLNIHWKD